MYVFDLHKAQHLGLEFLKALVHTVLAQQFHGMFATGHNRNRRKQNRWMRPQTTM